MLTLTFGICRFAAFSDVNTLELSAASTFTNLPSVRNMPNAVVVEAQKFLNSLASAVLSAGSAGIALGTHLDYSLASAATSTEAEELIEKAEEFRDLIEQWIKKNHPPSTL